VVILTPGSVHDVNILANWFTKLVPFTSWIGLSGFCPAASPPAAFGFFVTRARKTSVVGGVTRVRGQEHRSAFRPDRVLKGFYAQRAYPEPLRRIGYRDPQTAGPGLSDQQLTVPGWPWRDSITLAGKSNCSSNGSSNIAHQAFYGTGENAVRTQIWIAIRLPAGGDSQKRLHLDLSLYTMLQILSLTLFEKTPLLQAFSQQPPSTELLDSHVQPCLPAFNRDSSELRRKRAIGFDSG